MNANPWPVQIKLLRGAKELALVFDDGKLFQLSAEYLRISSPSAEVQGHHPSQKIIVAGKKNIAINQIESVGNYAIRLIFDDGHDTGIYSWSYLYELGEAYHKNWASYLAALKDKGLERNNF